MMWSNVTDLCDDAASADNVVNPAKISLLSRLGSGWWMVVFYLITISQGLTLQPCRETLRLKSAPASLTFSLPVCKFRVSKSRAHIFSSRHYIFQSLHGFPGHALIKINERTTFFLSFFQRISLVEIMIRILIRIFIHQRIYRVCQHKFLVCSQNTPYSSDLCLFLSPQKLVFNNETICLTNPCL